MGQLTDAQLDKAAAAFAAAAKATATADEWAKKLCVVGSGFSNVPGIAPVAAVPNAAQDFKRIALRAAHAVPKLKPLREPVTPVKQRR